jgi:hypothetical protein
MNDVLTYLYFGATSLMSVPKVPKRQMLVITIFGLSGVVATVLAGFRAWEVSQPSENGPFKVDHPRILMIAEMFAVIAASTIFTITSL